MPCVALVTRLHVSGDPTFEEFAAVVPKPVKRATLVAALAKVLVQAAAAASLSRRRAFPAGRHALLSWRRP